MKWEHPSLWLVRCRCAAFGAALALTLGYGGLNYAGATTSRAVGNVFVPIVPCRLFDTRPAPAIVGSRARPLTADEEFLAQVTGANGDCSLPATSTAVVLNVTAVSPVGDGFLTIWPADAPRPNTSNLNFSDGQAPVANAVTVKLGGGAIRLASPASRVDAIADVVGYFEDHNLPDKPHRQARQPAARFSTRPEQQTFQRRATNQNVRLSTAWPEASGISAIPPP